MGSPGHRVLHRCCAARERRRNRTKASRCPTRSNRRAHRVGHPEHRTHGSRGGAHTASQRRKPDARRSGDGRVGVAARRAAALMASGAARSAFLIEAITLPLRSRRWSEDRCGKRTGLASRLPSVSKSQYPNDSIEHVLDQGSTDCLGLRPRMLSHSKVAVALQGCCRSRYH